MIDPSAAAERAPLILTATFDAPAGDIFQTLRNECFPAKRNIVPAHLTLFHHLPGAEEAAIRAVLAEFCAARSAMPFASTGLRFLGRGVAVEIGAGPLVALRHDLATRWHDWLTAQDRQGFRPHVTVQNKAPAVEARTLHDRLAATLPPIHGTVTGLDLWFYRGGPWDFAGHYAFKA